MTQQALAALGAAGVSTAIADILDLAWLQGFLRPITDTVARQDWFAEQVQEVYVSDLLDRLVDEDATSKAGGVQSVSVVCDALLAAYVKGTATVTIKATGKAAA
ncbi:hypothetical protein [Streptomyces sp. bgisy095]|uniref:hypothetical protein n=1 Tax=unclassified Streptomyces TaxID=2593676 RepID=UPI003D72300B